MTNEEEQAQLEQEAQEGGSPPDAPQPVSGPDDGADGPEVKSEFTNRRPQKTAGRYVVLVADLARKIDDERAFVVLGFVKANDDEQAKRKAMNDPVHGPRLDELAGGAGVVLHAVPLRSWPKTEPTKYAVTKRLVIG